MNRQSSRIGASGLLLTETLIAVLFFSVASAICLQLFVKAHTVTHRTEALELAVSQGSSVVSLLEQMPADSLESVSDPGNTAQLLQIACDAIMTVYPDAILADDKVLICFDKNGEHCTQSDQNCAYHIAVTCDEKESKHTNGHAYLLYHVSVMDPKKETEEDSLLQTYKAAVCRPYVKEAPSHE